MATWERQWFEEEIRKLVKQAEERGVEDAVAPFAASVLADYPPEKVAAYLDALRAKHHIKGDDALAAYRVYEAHIIAEVPRPIKILWSVFKRILPSWTVTASPERVVIRTPTSSGKVLCPVIRATGSDLEKARPICESLFCHDAFAEPMSTLVAKAVNPRLRWELQEFRSRPDFPCYYAIVFDPE